LSAAAHSSGAFPEPAPPAPPPRPCGESRPRSPGSPFSFPSPLSLRARERRVSCPMRHRARRRRCIAPPRALRYAHCECPSFVAEGESARAESLTFNLRHYLITG
jgi:hypothetical protein